MGDGPLLRLRRRLPAGLPPSLPERALRGPAPLRARLGDALPRRRPGTAGGDGDGPAAMGELRRPRPGGADAAGARRQLRPGERRVGSGGLHHLRSRDPPRLPALPRPAGHRGRGPVRPAHGAGGRRFGSPHPGIPGISPPGLLRPLPAPPPGLRRGVPARRATPGPRAAPARLATGPRVDHSSPRWNGLLPLRPFRLPAGRDLDRGRPLLRGRPHRGFPPLGASLADVTRYVVPPGAPLPGAGDRDLAGADPGHGRGDGSGGTAGGGGRAGHPEDRGAVGGAERLRLHGKERRPRRRDRYPGPEAPHHKTGVIRLAGGRRRPADRLGRRSAAGRRAPAAARRLGPADPRRGDRGEGGGGGGVRPRPAARLDRGGGAPARRRPGRRPPGARFRLRPAPAGDPAGGRRRHLRLPPHRPSPGRSFECRGRDDRRQPRRPPRREQRHQRGRPPLRRLPGDAPPPGRAHRRERAPGHRAARPGRGARRDRPPQGRVPRHAGP